jgi:hypothetical protein
MDYENDISVQLATAAHSGTSFVPEQRANQVRADYANHLRRIRETLDKYATDDSSRALVDAQFERYRANFRKHYTAWLSAKSRIMSPMISGGSNFPVRRMEKANRAERNRGDDLLKWQERALRAILRILRKATAADPLEDLREQLAKREARQEQSKKINAIIRKHRGKPDAQVAGLMAELGISEAGAREILKPDVMGHVGIPDYSLRNNLANIKRIRGRIAELEAKERVKETLRAEGAEMRAREFNGGRLVENVELDRLQLIFPGKPSEPIRKLLKSNGFRWAPSEGAWQRQLTGNAHAAARLVIARIEEGRV